MARNKTVYDYYFKEGKGPELLSKAKLNYEVAKIATDGSGEPENIYHIWGDNEEDLTCDCPAAYHHSARGPCKHVDWIRRWLAIQEDTKNSNSNYSLTPVYYSAADNAFYKLPSDHIEDTIGEENI